MRDTECVQLLQTILPKMGLRWRGFRKVRRQVCRRVARRIGELGLSDVSAYVHYLDGHPAERSVLDAMCSITISRFWRNRGVWEGLGRVLADLAVSAHGRGETRLRALCAGAASGEEPYSLVMLWRLVVLPSLDMRMDIEVTALEWDESVIERARRGVYRESSLRDVPSNMVSHCFEQSEEGFRLRDEFRSGVRFVRGDIRRGLSDGPYHLIMCRNLAFTYYDEQMQGMMLQKMDNALLPGGILVLGSHEGLPGAGEGFSPLKGLPGVFRKSP